MNIISGLQPGQVVQQDDSGTASLVLRGACAASGSVGVTVSGLKGRPALIGSGSAKNGEWEAHVDDIPAGGPYQLEVICGAETSESCAFYVGEVWALAGQSNMEGVGDLCNVEPPSPLVRAMGLSDDWGMAEEPIHWLFESVDSAHWPCQPEEREHFATAHRADRSKGAGLGLPFGAALSASLGVPIGLIACARGGTSMQEWSPDRLPEGGASLYGSLVRRIRKVGKVRGVLWYQGESDANPADAPAFQGRFRTLVESLRRDVDAPALPFLWVQLGRFVAEGTLADLRSWNAVQEAQRLAVLGLPAAAMTAAIDLELDDAIHIGTAGLKRLGRRLAAIARKDVYGDTALHRGPALHSVRVEGDNRDRVRVEYAEVNGTLDSPGRLSGFSFRDHDGRSLPIIYKAEIDPVATNAVILWLTCPVPHGCALHYGWGRDPYCNLIDAMDFAAPVFGPAHLD